MNRAVFDLGHAGCGSCKRAIEHAGRRISGVRDIELNLASRRLSVDYNGEPGEVIREVEQIVEKLGYEAALITEAEAG